MDAPGLIAQNFPLCTKVSSNSIIPTMMRELNRHNKYNSQNMGTAVSIVLQF